MIKVLGKGEEKHIHYMFEQRKKLLKKLFSQELKKACFEVLWWRMKTLNDSHFKSVVYIYMALVHFYSLLKMIKFWNEPKIIKDKK